MRRQALKLLPRLAIGGQAQQQNATVAARAMLGMQLQLRGFADDANLKKTVLYDFHVAHGGAWR
jgi:aminomethyltransferase